MAGILQGKRASWVSVQTACPPHATRDYTCLHTPDVVPQVEGGRTMKLRVYDEAYLGHVDRFWNTLLPKMAPYLYHRGGPILMTQVGILLLLPECWGFQPSSFMKRARSCVHLADRK